MKTYHIIIEGKVQGVGFRSFVLSKAYRYGLKGTVKNDEEKERVEIFCQGNDKKITGFIKEIEHGPALSIVLSVKKDIIEESEYRDFRIIH